MVDVESLAAGISRMASHRHFAACILPVPELPSLPGLQAAYAVNPPAELASANQQAAGSSGVAPVSLTLLQNPAAILGTADGRVGMQPKESLEILGWQQQQQGNPLEAKKSLC